MAKTKKEDMDVSFQIEDLKNKIKLKDDLLQKANERLKKEEELLDLHKSKVKKFMEEIKKLNLEKNSLRMNFMDIVADNANIDRNEFFEQTMTSIANNYSKPPKEESSTDEKDKKTPVSVPQKKEPPIKEESQPIDNITPLAQARAEYNKKHPDGFSAAERSKH